jgi:hypothetical protein
VKNPSNPPFPNFAAVQKGKLARKERPPPNFILLDTPAHHKGNAPKHLLRSLLGKKAKQAAIYKGHLGQ